MKYPPRHVTFSQDCRFFRKIHLLEIADQIQVCRAMRLGYALELALHERRNHSAILRQLVLPPTNREIAPKRLAIVEASSDYRGLEISTWLHGQGAVASGGDVLSFCTVSLARRSRRTMPR